MSLHKNKLLIAALLGLLLSILIILIFLSRVFSISQLQFADQLYGGKKPSSDIVIIAVDETSLSDQAGLGRYENWNRNYFAQALENINQAQPKIVAFDFFFHSPKDEAGDKRFAQALANTENPFIIYPGNPTSYDQKQGFFVQEKNRPQAELPLKLFLETKNLTVTLANIIRDQDLVMRRIIRLIYDEATGVSHENLAFSIARRVLGEKGFHDSTLEHWLEHGQMLINFASVPGGSSFQKISFIDVYKKNFQPDFFKNKIVLIGPTAFFFKDSYFTPVDKSTAMPGVEIQANALQTILERNFLHNLDLPQEIAILVLICFATVFIFMFTRIRLSLAFMASSGTLYTIAAPLAFQHGLILDLVHPYLALMAAFIACYLYRYFTEFREKLALRGAFAKYVSPKVIDEIMGNPDELKLGGQKRDVTVLFTDIAHFTSISENLKPESLVALLNEYFQAMSEIILAEGGTLDKFEGDAIMAFFGAPLTQTDHALRACRAALNMRKKLTELLRQWQTDGPLPGGEKKPALDFRCGISSGEVIVGNMGSSNRFDYTVMGDIVNLGSRLEGANKKYDTRIMVSEATAKLVQNEFEMRELDTMKVVGKSRPIKVFEILNFKGRLVAQATELLKLYNQGLELYHQQKFADARTQFAQLLKIYPEDGPSKLYLQRCEVLKDFPPKTDWDGVFEMGTK